MVAFAFGFDGLFVRCWCCDLVRPEHRRNTNTKEIRLGRSYRYLVLPTNITFSQRYTGTASVVKSPRAMISNTSSENSSTLDTGYEYRLKLSRLYIIFYYLILLLQPAADAAD